MALDPQQEDPVPDETRPEPPPRWDILALTARPELLPLLVASVATGLAVGWFMFPDGWTPLYRVGAGLLLGFGSWLILYLNRMIGGSDFN